MPPATPYILVVTGGAAMAALIFATAIAVRRYAILPRWVSWFGFVAGVAAIFSVIFFTMLVLAALGRRRVGDALPGLQAGGSRGARAVRGNVLERRIDAEREG